MPRSIKTMTATEKEAMFLRLVRAGQNDLQLRAALSASPRELRRIAVRAGRRVVCERRPDSDLPPAA